MIMTLLAFKRTGIELKGDLIFTEFWQRKQIVMVVKL